MSKNIYFDTTDWSTIEDTIEKVNAIGCVQLGTTADGEAITFDVCSDADGNDVLHTTVLQHNGWERHNYYHPSDYTVEEMYHRPRS